jgi:hypothetical protein
VAVLPVMSPLGGQAFAVPTLLEEQAGAAAVQPMTSEPALKFTAWNPEHVQVTEAGTAVTRAQDGGYSTALCAESVMRTGRHFARFSFGEPLAPCCVGPIVRFLQPAALTSNAGSTHRHGRLVDGGRMPSVVRRVRCSRGH